MKMEILLFVLGFLAFAGITYGAVKIDWTKKDTEQEAITYEAEFSDDSEIGENPIFYVRVTPTDLALGFSLKDHHLVNPYAKTFSNSNQELFLYKAKALYWHDLNKPFKEHDITLLEVKSEKEYDYYVSRENILEIIDFLEDEVGYFSILIDVEGKLWQFSLPTLKTINSPLKGFRYGKR